MSCRNGSWRSRRKKQLRKLYKTCCWCARPLEWLHTTIEHVVPRSRGGTDDIENLRLACKRCNRARGNEPRDLERDIAARATDGGGR